VSGSKCGEERRGVMVGDRDERRGSIGTLGTKWIGAGGERTGKRGRKKIVAPASAERRTGLRFCIQNHEGCGADGREKRNQLANWGTAVKELTNTQSLWTAA